MSSQTFNLSLPEALVAKLDAQAQREFSSRSDYVRKAIVNQLNTEQALQAVFDRSNQKVAVAGITSERQVYDIIDGA